MALTQNSYTGNGSTVLFSFTFPYLQEADVKVKLDGVTQATTAYSFANATTVQMGTAPGNGVTVLIFRDTNNDAKKATFYPGSAIKAEDLNDDFDQILYVAQEVDNYAMTTLGDDEMIGDFKMGSNRIIFEGATANDHETFLTVADPTADRTITLPNVTGTVITTGDTGTITSAMIEDGTFTDADINANAAIAGTKINLVTTSVQGVMSAADKTKLNAIESNATADQTATEIKTLYEQNSDTNAFTDADHSKLDAIEAGATGDQTNAEIRAAVEAATDSNVFTDADHTKLNAIEAGATGDQTASEIRTLVESASDSNVFTDADHTKLNNIETAATADQTASEIKALIASSPLDASHLATNSVTTDEIADAELTTLAGMQSGTASILASGTALTATNAEINAVCDGKTVQTTISDTDASYPTSGAVVDYVAAQIAPLGGLEVIANEDSFPTQPASGVVISIADAGGIVINGSGVSTTARTSGNGSDNVTINGFPSTLYSTTLTDNMGLLVSSTGSSNTYTYHKLLGKESDIKSLSDDINDFNNRYRVAASAPSSSLDDGDLWFDTTNNEMKVYNATGSSWDVVTSVGDFNINTISSSGNTGGGSATFNGTAYRFVLSNPPTSAQQLIVSVNGVIQKPNAGSSQPSEGFAISGNDIIFAAAPPSGADYFITTQGSSVSVGTPSDNTISTAKLQNLAVTGDKIATNLDLADNKKIRFGTGNDLSIYHDGSHSIIEESGTGQLKVVTDSGFQLRNANATTGEYLINANTDGAVSLYYDGSKKFETTSGGVSVTGTFTASSTVNSGGHFKTNSDWNGFYCGASDDLKIYHDGSNSYITNATGHVELNSSWRWADNARVRCGASSDLELYHSGSTNYIVAQSHNLHIDTNGGNENAAKFIQNGSVELYYDSVLKLDTSSTGPRVYGNLRMEGDDRKIILGTGSDLQIYHSGTESWINNTTGDLILRNSASPGDVYIQAGGAELGVKVLKDAAVELYYDNSKKFETLSTGWGVADTIEWNATQGSLDLWDNKKVSLGNSRDLQIYHDGSHSYIHNNTGRLRFETDNLGFGFFKGPGSEYIAMLEADGACSFYYDNSKKFETLNSGARTYGIHQILGSEGGTAQLYLYADEGDDAADKWKINAQASDNTLRIQDIPDNGNWEDLIVCTNNTGVKLYYDNSAKAWTSSWGFQVDGNLVPQGDNSKSLGHSNEKWSVLYCANGTIQTSDRNEKNTIVESDLGLEFIDELKPVSYKFNGTDKTHYGLIAQDLEEVLEKKGKTLDDFAGIEKNEQYGLNYSELISPLIKAIQELSTEVETLKTKVAALEAK